MKRIELLLPLTGLLLLATTRDAQAYIDPGSSSYLFQLLIGGLAAVLFFFSSLKRKTIQIWRSWFSKSTPQGDPAPAKPVPSRKA